MNKSFNYLALRGSDVDDMEYVEKYNLDPKVAYTPRINDEMLDIVHKQNYDIYVKMGKSEGEATSLANEDRARSKSTIKQLLKGNK